MFLVLVLGCLPVKKSSGILKDYVFLVKIDFCTCFQGLMIRDVAILN